MGPSTCLPGARSVPDVFEGARVLKSEHMLGSLVLKLDAQRVFSKHKGITEWYKMGGKTNTKSRKISSIITVDINSLKSFKRES